MENVCDFFFRVKSDIAKKFLTSAMDASGYTSTLWRSNSLFPAFTGNSGGCFEMQLNSSEWYEPFRGFTFKTSDVESTPKDTNQTSIIFPGRWFLLFHLLPFDKHDVRLGKAIFINVSFPFLQAQCHWSMNYDQPGRQASFQGRILSPLRSQWRLQQKWLGEKSLYVCWPIPCPRVYQVAYLCSFLKVSMTQVFFPCCLVASIGKSHCDRLPFPPTIPIASTIYVTPYFNNKLLLVIFF